MKLFSTSLYNIFLSLYKGGRLILKGTIYITHFSYREAIISFPQIQTLESKTLNLKNTA